MNIFIASSSESLNYAAALKTLLEETRGCNVTVWKDAPFSLGETIIESLEKIKNLYDYAVFIFYPDDKITFREKTMNSVRDNVIFEFGLFVGFLGRKKCFAIIPEDILVKHPSDLLGVIFAKYNYNKNDDNPKSTLRSSSNEIKKAIKERQTSPDKSKNLIRGDFRDSIVDASINVDLIDHDLYKQWHKSMQKGEKVEEALLYWDRQTANKWLEYEKFSYPNLQSIQNTGKKVATLLNEPFALISLGPGSGKKDITFLNKAMHKDNVYWYYPIDISSHLLFQAMKNVTEEFDDTYLKVKGIRANFNSLEKLQFVYKYSNLLNIFSLLGNTLGNYNENELIDRIRKSMLDEDLFIIEVNNIESYNQSNKSKYENKNYQEFILEPLKSLGIVPKISNLKFEETNRNGSSINLSKRIFANYYFDKDELKIIGTDMSKLNITYSTHYSKYEIKKFFKKHSFQFLAEIDDPNSIILLFKK
jgi:hypothetical protein